MAQEGIAALPQSPENAAPPPEVGLDAGKNELLQQFGPEAMTAYEQTMTQAVGQLDVTPDQLEKLQQIIEYILKNYQNYPEIRKELIAQGLREDDLPPEFDASYFGTMQTLVSEALKRQKGTAPKTADQGPAMQAPEGSPLQAPQGFAQGGLAGAAESLRKKGRNGDTILAHINPQEAAMLKRMGGSGTINPRTGLPEFGFLGINLSDAWNSVKNVAAPILQSPVGKIVATAAITYALGPAGAALVSTPVAAAIAAGSITAIGGGDLKSSLISAATGYGMAYLAPQISDMLPGAGNAATGAAPSFLNAVMTGGAMGTGYGLITGQSLPNSLKMGLTGGALAGAANYLQAGPYAPKEGAPGAPVVDNSQSVVLQPDGTYAPAGTVMGTTPGGTTGVASTSDIANQITSSSGALTPDQVSATAPSGGISQIEMRNWLNQQSPADVNVGYEAGLGKPGQFVNGTYQPSPAIAPGGASALQSAQNTASFMGEQNYNPMLTTPGPQPTTQASMAKGAVSPGTAKGGWMDYVPDFMKSSDGSLSIPMTTAAVLGVGALSGGFKTASPSTTANTAYTGIDRDASGQPITGSDLVNQNPDKYVYKPNISTSNPVDPYSGNTTNPNSPNFVNTRQYGQARQTPYGMFNPPPMSGGIPSGGMTPSVPQPYNTAMMYDFLRPQRGYAEGGISEIYPRRTGGISGPGTGTSDSIPAMLSDGEFVITAKAVRGAGNGSRREGAKKLYRMMHALEKKAKK